MGRSGVNHAAYKRLEAMTTSLKMQQIQRRLGGNDLLNPPASDSGAVEVSLEPDPPGTAAGDELPKINPKRKEFEVPDRLDDDPGYVDRMFPRNAKKRNETLTFHKQHDAVQARKVELIESIDAVDKKIKERKEHNRDLREKSKQLDFQDNIMSERRAYRRKIDHENERLRKVMLESARLTHYKQTLDHMVTRLHKQQITFVRTLNTYNKAVALQRREADDVKEMADESNEERLAAETQLRDLKRKTRRKEEAWMSKIKELQQVSKQRELLVRQMDEQQELLAKRARDSNLRQTAARTGEQFAVALTRGKLGAFTQHVRVHEQAFEKIRMVTGLKSEDEILTRWDNQQEYLNEIESKIQDLAQERQAVEERVNILRSELDVQVPAGGASAEGQDDGPTQTNKAIEAALTSEYEKVSSNSKSAQQDLQRLALMVVSLRQGCGNIMTEANNAAKSAGIAAAEETTPSGEPSEKDPAVSMLERAVDKISDFLQELITSVTETKPDIERIDLDALTIAQHQAQTSALVTSNGNNIRIAAKSKWRRQNAAVDRNWAQNNVEDEADKPDISGVEALNPFGESSGKKRKGRGSKHNAPKLDDAKLAIQAKMEADFDQRLKRLSLRTGKSPSEVREDLRLIPRHHVDQVMDRRAMKYAAINLVRKVQKPKKKEKSDGARAVTKRLSRGH